MRSTESRPWSNDLPNLSANCWLSHTSLTGPLKTTTVVPVKTRGAWDTESYPSATKVAEAESAPIVTSPEPYCEKR